MSDVAQARQTAISVPGARSSGPPLTNSDYRRVCMTGRRLAIAVAGLLLFGAGRPALGDEAPPLETPPAAAITDRPVAGEPGPSGLPYTPPARPGQSLPLEPSRAIAFA